MLITSNCTLLREETAFLEEDEYSLQSVPFVWGSLRSKVVQTLLRLLASKSFYLSSMQLRRLHLA